MTLTGSEQAAIEHISAELQEGGYEVVIEPTGSIVPSFLGKYRPDLIAFKDGQPTVVVEVKKRSANAEKYISDIARLFEGKFGFEFRVHWILSLEAEELQSASLDALHARTKELTIMFERELYGPCLLLCWAMLEAVGRILYPEVLAKAQRPASVVQKLAAEGDLSIKEAEKLRQLYKVRNNLVHGVLDEKVDKESILFFRDVILRFMDPVSLFFDEAD